MARLSARSWSIAAFVIAAVSIGTMLSHGWVPIDEGTIVLSARLVREGYLPHMDFAYPYTGALAWWNALALRLGGDAMLAPRYALFGAFLLWLPAIWLLARRFVAPPIAAAAVVLSAWWSLLIYPAAMPTWYLLFLTTWILVALSRWSDDGRSRWLVAAGLAAGVSIIAKQTGLLTLVGAGFGVLAIHQGRERDTTARANLPRRADRLVIAPLLVAVFVPAALVARRGVLAGEVPMIALPLVAVIAALIGRERGLHADLGKSRRTLGAAWLTLAGSAAVAPVLFVAFYATHGAWRALFAGSIGGALRTAAAIESPMVPALAALGFGVPLAALSAVFLFRAPTRRMMTIALIVALAVLAAAAKLTDGYLAVWYFAMLLLPIAVGHSAWTALRDGAADRARGVALAIAAATALLALNQVPYAAPNYFGYVAPLAFLLVLIGVARSGREQRVLLPLSVLLVFGGWFHRIGNVGTVGVAPIWWDDAHELAGPHGKLLVSRADSANAARIMALIAEHGDGERFAAGPELPHLYVLAGTRRLVAQPYLLAPDASADSMMMATAIDTARNRVIVINDDPHFLPALTASARVWLVGQYPASERVGHLDVRWR